MSCKSVTIPYAISCGHAANATQTSYLVLKNDWSDDNDGNEVLAYGKLGDASAKEGSFDIPESLTVEG